VSPEVNADNLDGKMRTFAAGFRVRGWEGPFYTRPPETVAYYARFGEQVAPVWELWCEQRGVPNSRNPTQVGEPIRAAIRFDDRDLRNSAPNTIARRLAIAVAGRAAHECLEWTTFGRDLVVDPHGPEVMEMAVDIGDYLLNASASD
jgi:hypothetical protein